MKKERDNLNGKVGVYVRSDFSVTGLEKGAGGIRSR